jgi:hypothetical protein
MAHLFSSIFPLKSLIFHFLLSFSTSFAGGERVKQLLGKTFYGKIPKIIPFIFKSPRTAISYPVYEPVTLKIRPQISVMNKYKKNQLKNIFSLKGR